MCHHKKPFEIEKPRVLSNNSQGSNEKKGRRRNENQQNHQLIRESSDHTCTEQIVPEASNRNG